MALETTPYAVKRAIMRVLDEALNEGIEPGEAEYVSIFYGWKDVDAVGWFVVVGDTNTQYDSDNVRMVAASTLRRYDLTYNINIDVASGLENRTQQDAERQCYELYDRVLTPLVRGDVNGESLLSPLVPNAGAITPQSEDMFVSADDPGKPMYSVLRFILGVELIRD